MIPAFFPACQQAQRTVVHRTLSNLISNKNNFLLFTFYDLMVLQFQITVCMSFLYKAMYPYVREDNSALAENVSKTKTMNTCMY